MVLTNPTCKRGKVSNVVLLSTHGTRAVLSVGKPGSACVILGSVATVTNDGFSLFGVCLALGADKVLGCHGDY